MSTRALLRSLFAVILLMASGIARADGPATVTVGTYVNKIVDLSFKERKYTIDFYVWFRWKAEGMMADYSPIDSFEVINGRVEDSDKTSVVEKLLDDVNYASVRVTAIIWQNWALDNFPFDKQVLSIHLEDSQREARDLVFEADSENSRMGDEIGLSGWTISSLRSQVTNKAYLSNYGDTSKLANKRSEYSRVTMSMDLVRDNHGAAMKVLFGMVVATLVAFVAFMIKPTDVDPRFGLGVGALFAVTANAFLVAESVPDSSALTLADQMYMIAIAFIFASLVQSALCLRWDEAGQEARSRRLDRWCVIAFPLLFGLIIGSLVLRALR